jgi:hypothetical protein
MLNKRATMGNPGTGCQLSSERAIRLAEIAAENAFRKRLSSGWRNAQGF